MVLINIDQLSDAELRYIASQENLDGWESLSREDLIEALEDFYDEDTSPLTADSSRKFVKSLTNVNSDVLQLPGVEPLPENFNTTEIHCIIMDANWAYAYWSIEQNLRNKIEASNATVCIRVEENLNNGAKPESFDISISLSDNSWNIELPMEGVDYRLSLVVTDSEGIEVVASSETITSPTSWAEKNKRSLSQSERFKILAGSLISKEGETINNRQVREILSFCKKEEQR